MEEIKKEETTVEEQKYPELKYHEEITDDKEQEAIKQLKTSLSALTKPEEKELITPELLMDTDLLIRFLRSEKLVVKKTVPLIINCMQWRKVTDLDAIYNFKLTKEQVNVFLRLYPNGYHKTSKSGHPVYIQAFGRVKPDELFAAVPIQETLKYSLRNYVQMERVHLRLCSEQQKKCLWGSFNIIDCKALTRSVFNKKLYSFIKENSENVNKYYPECLKGVFMVNAGLLLRSLYTIVKVFLDQKTKSQLKIYGTSYQKEILEIIDKENLPTWLGGTCECEGGCIFSNAGPWKDICKREETDLLEPSVREEINNWLKNTKG